MSVSFLLKDSLVYGVTSQISRLSSLIIIPFVTSNFPKEIYAIYDSFNALSFVLLALIIIGQDSAVARYFYDTDDPVLRGKVIFNGLVTEVTFSLIILLPLVSFSSNIATFYINENSYADTLSIVFFTLPFRAVTQFFQNLLKWTFRRKYYVILTLGHTFLLVFTVLAGIFFFNFAIQELFISFLFSYVVSTIVGFFLCRDLFTLSLDFKLLVSMLKFGWPYAIMGIIAQLYPALDRKIISELFTLNELAIYALAFRVGSLLRIPMGAFMMAWGPFAYSNMNEENKSKLFTKILFYSTAFIGFVGLLIIVGSDLLVIIFGGQGYLEATNYIDFIVIGLLIESMALITGMGIDFSKKSYLTAVSYLVSIIVGFMSMYFLSINLGIIGVPLGFLLGKVSLTLTKTILASSVYPMSFSFKGVSYLILFLVSISLFKLFLGLDTVTEKILYSVVVSVIYGSVVYFLIPASELQWIKIRLKEKFRL